VTTLALDANGLLKEESSVSALPADTKLIPGAPRPTPGRNVDNDIWASDVHLTPNGRLSLRRPNAPAARSPPSASTPPAESSRISASRPRRSSRAAFASIRPDATWWFRERNRNRCPSYAIDASTGALGLIGQYPTGKGSNWVEIVAFD
jgi:6-phosphogluconolactonase